MIKNIRWKIVTILCVFVIFTGLGVYPILAQRYGLPAPAWLKSKQLRLGLDLKGGVHLVMRVQTGDAIRIFTTTTSEQLRESLRTVGVNFASIVPASENSFRIEGVAPDRDAEFRRIADEQVAQNYDRSSATGGTYTFTMKPNVEADMR
jgi:preprotein translocase subunit SecD